MANTPIAPLVNAAINSSSLSSDRANIVATKPPEKSEFVVDPVRPIAVDRTPVATEAEMADRIDHLNRMMKEQGRNVSFSYDEQIDQKVIRVVDDNTGELIRQFPSAELMHAYKQIDHVMGLLFDRRA